MHRLGIDIKLALMLIKRRHKYLSHFDTLDRFIGEGSGPQEFCYELLNHYIDRKLGFPTINPWGSSFNLINSGSISIVNKYLLPFSKTKNILRMDGVSVDSAKDYSEYLKIKAYFQRLIDLSSGIVFQSKFAKDCAELVYSINKPSVIIRNGATPLIDNLSLLSKSYLSKSNIPSPYFVVAGRSSPRKRIDMVISNFMNYPDYNLVILSDLKRPNSHPFPDNLFYLGLRNSTLARGIIANSIALIHLDSYDWCPNLVVNAHSDGVRVISSNFGGTPELSNKENCQYIIPEYTHHKISSISQLRALNSSLISPALLRNYLDIAYHDYIDSGRLPRRNTLNLTLDSYLRFGDDCSLHHHQ